MGVLLPLLGQLGHIFYFIVFPMLLLAGVGFFLQRKMRLDMPTLTRLNFFFVMPGIIFSSVVDSPLSGGDAARVVLFSLGSLAVLFAVAWGALRLANVPPEYRRAMILTVLLCNSGNYAMPLLDRAFHADGLSNQAVLLQSFVMITQNLFTFTVGILIVAGGRKDRHWKHNLLEMVKFPPIYALAAALLTVQVRRWLGPNAPRAAEAFQPFWAAITYVRQAFFAVALCTLGAQLAAVRPDGPRHPVRLSVALRLLAGPAVGLALVYVLGFRGFLAQVLLIASAGPTALNCMLLCLEFRNQPEYAARAVFYSTIVSPITVTLVVFLARSGLLPGFSL